MVSTTHYRAFVGKYHLGFRHPEWDYFRLVDGYDPRPGCYRVNENGVDVWPNVYQTKYIGDVAKQAIAQSGNRPFFLTVAPTPDPRQYFRLVSDIQSGAWKIHRHPGRVRPIPQG